MILLRYHFWIGSDTNCDITLISLSQLKVISKMVESDIIVISHMRVPGVYCNIEVLKVIRASPGAAAPSPIAHEVGTHLKSYRYDIKSLCIVLAQSFGIPEPPPIMK